MLCQIDSFSCVPVVTERMERFKLVGKTLKAGILQIKN